MLSLTDPSASQSNSEERLNHEAQELEKRLSMLSHRSSTGTPCITVLRFKLETKDETAAKNVPILQNILLLMFILHYVNILKHL